MRRLQTTFLTLFGFAFFSLLPLQELMAQQSFYDFSVEDLHGEEFDLAQLQGKKVLVVNTASKCALTPQYEGLERLYRMYGGDDFIILAFPSNDFGSQDPGSNSEIATFCSTKYEITFPVMAKITVKGEQKHSLYKWLTEASENGVEESRVTWNFQKFMIDEGGTLVGHVPPWRKPECKEIISWITAE
ncbi:MAG: glutathione peroxidase [Bacteroidales bacterium]|nr:glutathione peroxidase [Bacteroidales bacterium]